MLSRIGKKPWTNEHWLNVLRIFPVNSVYEDGSHENLFKVENSTLSHQHPLNSLSILPLSLALLDL